MSVSVKLILTLVIGYLLGSISTGVIVSRVFGHKDIRSEGSGNSGTTNMLRVMGKKYALLTFAGDLLKGIVAVLIGKAWLGTQAGEIVGAFGAILGHNFPLYFGFKGGKGIATSFGCLLIVFPVQTLCAFGVFLLIVALTRYVSAGSLGAAVTLPFFIMLTTPCNPVIWGSVIAICLLAIWRHAPNIKRLMNHTESKISLSKKKESRSQTSSNPKRSGFARPAPFSLYGIEWRAFFYVGQASGSLSSTTRRLVGRQITCPLTKSLGSRLGFSRRSCSTFVPLRAAISSSVSPS